MDKYKNLKDSFNKMKALKQAGKLQNMGIYISIERFKEFAKEIKNERNQEIFEK